MRLLIRLGLQRPRNLLPEVEKNILLPELVSQYSFIRSFNIQDDKSRRINATGSEVPLAISGITPFSLSFNIPLLIYKDKERERKQRNREYRIAARREEKSETERPMKKKQRKLNATILRRMVCLSRTGVVHQANSPLDKESR